MKDFRLAIFIDVDGTLLPYNSQVVPASARDALTFLIDAPKSLPSCPFTVYPVWCTAWLEDADTVIGPQVGLSGLPYLPFELPWESEDAQFAFASYENYKVPDMTRYIKNHKIDAAVVLDDEIQKETDLEGHFGVPTYLIQTHPNECLTSDEVYGAIEWIRNL